MLENENQITGVNINQEIENIYQNLEKTVDSKVRSFIAKKQQEIEKAFKDASLKNDLTPNSNTPSFYQQKSLPWFAGGIRGFLRKLWHGDSASNPDWQWNTVKESFTINEYFYIKSEIENILFETEMLNSDDIKSLVTDIMISVRKAVEDTKLILNKSKRSSTKWKRNSDVVPNDPVVSKEPQIDPVPEVKPQEKSQIDPPVSSNDEIKTNGQPSDVDPTPTPPSDIQASSSELETKPKRRRIGVLGQTRPKAKKQKEEVPELSFDEMKLKAEDAKSIAENINFILNEKLPSYYGSNLTRTEKQEKAAIIKEMAEMLKEKGIEITNNHFIASTESNAIKLVQIMKELDKIEQYYNWREIENYHVAFPEILYNNTDGLIKKAIEMSENESKPESQPNYSESLNYYLNNKNKLKIEEKKSLFVNLLKENSQESLNILKYKKNKDRKLNLIKR